MEFSGQYLTYEEYRGLGGTLDLMPFNLLELEVRNLVDLRTQNRLINQEIPFKVKICEYHLIEKINSYKEEIDNINNMGSVASENIDGYSISYTSSSHIKEIISSRDTELNDILLTDLYGVIVDNEHIIYNGVK